MRFIFTTDGHLSTKRPIARTEETDELYIEHQLDKRRQMFDYAKNNDIKSIIDGGDFFSYWKMDNSNALLIKSYFFISRNMIFTLLLTIGNHDLPFHNIENIEQSLIGVLNKIGLVKIGNVIEHADCIINFFHYGNEIIGSGNVSDIRTNIAVIHDNIFQYRIPFYMTGYTAQELIDMLPNYDLFLCGHNHEQFIYKKDNKYVVNGGSVMRLTTNQNNFEPAFYDITVDGHIDIKKIKFNILPNMISDEHLKNKKIETFVSSTQDFAEGKRGI